MAWSGSSSEEMKRGSERLLGLVSPELSPTSQDPVRSAGGKGINKRPHNSAVNLSFEVDDDGIIEDQSHPGKKRRLTGEQVRFLEMSFEMENKLEPERKALIAKHLGLLPRQVAIWFQNRRARWKNKQLEQECETLKVKVTTVLKENENIIQKNEALLEANKKLQAEVARLMGLLRSSEHVCMITDGSVSQVMEGVNAMANASTGMIVCEATESGGDDASEGQQPADDGGSLCTGKSDLTKSEDQSEVQDSGRSYPSMTTPSSAIPPPSSLSSSSAATATATAAATTTTTITFAQAPAPFEVAAMADPWVKLEDPTHLFSEDVVVGNLFNPFLFQHLAASGVYLEDVCNVLFGWEDPSPGLSWDE